MKRINDPIYPQCLGRKASDNPAVGKRPQDNGSSETIRPEQWDMSAFRCYPSLLFRLLGVKQGNEPKEGGNDFRPFKTGLFNNIR